MAVVEGQPQVVGDIPIAKYAGPAFILTTMPVPDKLFATLVVVGATCTVPAPVLRAADPVASSSPPVVSTNRVVTFPRPVAREPMTRARLLKKLHSIVLDEIVFDGLTLETVVRILEQKSRELDPEGVGVQFMFASPSAGLPPPSTLAATVPGLDPNAVPATVAPAPVAPVNLAALDLRQAVISVRSPLRNIRLLHVLDVVSKSSDQPVLFAAHDYALVIVPRVDGNFTRGFRTSPTMFQQGLQGVFATPPGTAP